MPNLCTGTTGICNFAFDRLGAFF